MCVRVIIVLPLSIGATASHASLVISHSSVKGLSEAPRVNLKVDFDDIRCTAGAKASDLNMAAAMKEKNASISCIYLINGCS